MTFRRASDASTLGIPEQLQIAIEYANFLLVMLNGLVQNREGSGHCRACRTSVE